MTDDQAKLAKQIAELVGDVAKMARAKALDEAAAVAAKEGVYPQLNVWGGGPEWYRHGQKIAAAILALKDKPTE